MKDLSLQEYIDVFKKSGMDKAWAKKYMNGFSKDYSFEFDFNKWKEDVDKTGETWAFTGESEYAKVTLAFAHDGETVDSMLEYTIWMPSGKHPDADPDISSGEIEHKIMPRAWRQNPAGAMKTMLRGLKDKFYDELGEIPGISESKLVRGKLGLLAGDLDCFLADLE